MWRKVGATLLLAIFGWFLQFSTSLLVGTLAVGVAAIWFTRLKKIWRYLLVVFAAVLLLLMTFAPSQLSERPGAVMSLLLLALMGQSIVWLMKTDADTTRH